MAEWESTWACAGFGCVRLTWHRALPCTQNMYIQRNWNYVSANEQRVHKAHTHKIRSTSLFRSTPIIIGGVRRAGHTDCSAWTNRPTWTNTTESTYTLNVCCVLCCAAVVVMWCEMMLGAAGWYWTHASPTKLRCDVCMAASCTIAHNHIQFDVWLWQPKRERERESEERCADMYVEWVHRQFPDVYMKWE